MRRTKIIATLGPASGDPEVVADLLEAGTDVVRLSLAHGSVADHRKRIVVVRELAESMGRTVGVLADLPGPKVGPVRSPTVAPSWPRAPTSPWWWGRAPATRPASRWTRRA